jgi:hypothetical protein
VITGRSAATLRGVPLARTDPVGAVVGLDTRVFRRAGLDLRRCEVRDGEAQAWSGIRMVTRQRSLNNPGSRQRQASMSRSGQPNGAAWVIDQRLPVAVSSDRAVLVVPDGLARQRNLRYPRNIRWVCRHPSHDDRSPAHRVKFMPTSMTS